MAIYKRKIVPLQLIMTIQDKFIELAGLKMSQIETENVTDTQKMSQTESENVTELTSDELNLSLEPQVLKSVKEKKKRRKQAIVSLMNKDSHIKVEAIAEKLDVHKRTVLRDIDEIPIDVSHASRKAWDFLNQIFF